MPITYRFKQRQKQLEKPFNKDTLKKLWKKKVRGQVRSMSIHDLHDFYDFHRRLDDNVSKINERVLSGQYKVQVPLIYDFEKKFGICRHMIVLSPSDSLVLQALIEAFANELISKAPSEHAYYSRDVNPSLKLPHEIGSIYDGWFHKWQIYQKEILLFTDTKKYIITTDLSNYYDSIRLKELRSVISSYINCDEVLLDLLFDTIENLSWRPDYLPNQSIGLPVINLESIRLLAHAFLFEIDYVLKNQFKENFVRWMDDIIIGVDDIDEAKQILKGISDVLKSRGLSLNMSKTKIFTSEEAKKHFLFNENSILEDFEHDKPSQEIFMKEFRINWENNKQYRYFDKVLKRFLTIAGKYKFSSLLEYLPQIFQDYSDVRTNVCSYLHNLGFNKETATVFKSLLEIKQYDDISLFLLISLVTDWNTDCSDNGKNFINQILEYLKKIPIKDREFNFYSYLWFAAKYEQPQQLYAHLNKYKNFWIRNPFLTRQVASIIPRLLPNFGKEYEELSNFILQRDYNDSSSVIYNFKEIRTAENIRYLKEYLFPANKHKKGYPLSKFLILYNFLLNGSSNKYFDVHKEIREHIQDSWFLSWLKGLENVPLT